MPVFFFRFNFLLRILEILNTTNGLTDMDNAKSNIQNETHEPSNVRGVILYTARLLYHSSANL
jgi:hypothetical protein